MVLLVCLFEEQQLLVEDPPAEVASWEELMREAAEESLCLDSERLLALLLILVDLFHGGCASRSIFE